MENQLIHNHTVLPFYSTEKHSTLFGGIRDDIIVIHFSKPGGLQEDTPLETLVQHCLPNVTDNNIKEMLAFGSIYLTSIQLPNKYKEISRRSAHREKMYKHKTTDINLNSPIITRRLTKGNIEKFPISHFILPKGSLSIRFHLYPQRFLIASLINWRSRECHVSDDLIIINKPAGIPCEPIASNYIECVHVQAGLSLMGDVLRPLNRIDIWTTGIVCLARTEKGSTLFNYWQRQNFIKKTYRLLASMESSDDQDVMGLLSSDKKVLPFELIHWMPNGSAFHLAAPRVVHRKEIPQWKRCVSNVIKIEEVLFKDIYITDDMESKPLGYKNKMEENLLYLHQLGHRFFECDVELITGRTHQLRAQFAACGLPLVCDSLYYPLRGVTMDNLDVERVMSLNFNPIVVEKKNIDLGFLTANESDILNRMKKTKKLNCPIGLQAHRIVIEHLNNDIITCNNISVSAGNPWWFGGKY